ncbi:MAG: sugar ABC transporter ATP-binding protein [Blastocatellia bacterium]|nr:sugar ABC transporter ATP-binding protein [Blastocatellia bacterium]MCS7156356.1 sugar ABC transporter ATP-binding protein [Blastocatellia bacterium]MCX7751293.1 sugar ABC transporter ATP-binding protein [Blastocatellia bacterium]MDW8169005.1 sugar ABC transporter ATP-binding protein [Acidobacteriota bacterium]MDW8256764.1 sugar ABC transporter ATP-binding protein [Acidobacteriota bacterium]
MPSSEVLLRLEGITKTFGGIVALDDVDFEVKAGEVHALIGENGAGKSTLVKIATGVHASDRGRILWKGRAVKLQTPRDAHRLGIRMVPQELTLVPQLSVGENVFLGGLPSQRMLFSWVRWSDIHERARALLRELGHDIDPRRPASELSVAEQQLVEIARALAFEAELMVLDEPTSPLSERETERLFQTITRLKARGMGIVYITHRMREIYAIADRVTVLRDGRRILTKPISETSPEELVRAMVGREWQDYLPEQEPRTRGAPILRVEGLTAPGRFYDITFTVHRGEIVGLAGLVGAGRTELVEALFGAREYASGQILIDGCPVTIRTPADAIRHGMALVTDDRRAKGLIPTASVHTNVILSVQTQLARFGFLVRARAERQITERFLRELRVKTPSVDHPVMLLSGGNQQKIILARWLSMNPRIFLLDEPTRGIDVAAKAEIYEVIRRLAAQGAAILLVSSELEEIRHLADRVLVMHRGRIVGELRREEVTDDRILYLATGGEG